MMFYLRTVLLLTRNNSLLYLLVLLSFKKIKTLHCIIEDNISHAKTPERIYEE